MTKPLSKIKTENIKIIKNWYHDIVIFALNKVFIVFIGLYSKK